MDYRNKGTGTIYHVTDPKLTIYYDESENFEKVEKVEKADKTEKKATSKK